MEFEQLKATYGDKFLEDWNEFLDFFFEIRKGEFFAWMGNIGG